MKLKQALALLALITFFLSCTNQEPQKAIVKKKEKKAKFTGTKKTYYDKGEKQIKSKIDYKNGVRHGQAVDYYKNGQVRLQGGHDHGLKDGDFVWFYENGNKYKHIGYREGSIHGWDSLFFKSGYHKHAIPYQNGILQEGSKEWSSFHKEIELPKITVQQKSFVTTKGEYHIYAQFKEPVKNCIFEIGLIGNGTKESPEQAFERMIFIDKAEQKGLYIVRLPAGYEIIGKLAIKGRGLTKRGNPFLTYKVVPVVMR